MFDAEVNSGFTTGGDINISNRFTEITLLHKSSNGYTDVYKAKRYGQWHVLKCLTDEAALDIQYQTLLEKEFRLSYPLSHSNIVRTLGFERVDEIGKYCIIQEYIDGAPVTSITKEQAIELCDATRYLHEVGVIHRDIKPENILVRKDNGHIVLIDFGLADKVDFSILKGGAGTSGYAAPEQWKGDISPLADIYGIGSVLLSNKHLRKIATKCRKTNPQERYQSAERVKQALQRRFPWSIVCAIFAILLLAIWSGYNYQAAQNYNLGSQKEIQNLQNKNSRLTEEIDSLHQKNEQLHQKQTELQRALEREHNTNVRLMYEVHPMQNTYGSSYTSEDQRY